jgi:Pyridoxamine 5'-phosphate oxidase
MAPPRGPAYAGGMSIPVQMERLRAAIEERSPTAYVLTVSDDGRPHAVHVPVRWEGDTLAVEVGRRTATNARARPSISLLYPLRTEGDYSLIVEGSAAVVSDGNGGRLLVTPTRAVLHRPAAGRDPTASSCDADCVPLLPAR